MIRISVIIATRNRAEALKMISLPSLTNQTFKDFEVIVWDASDDDSSKKVVEEFKREHLGMDVKYFKAPRKGLSSQRNDAVKVAKGEIIYFIDDDSELSKNALEVVYKTLKDSKYIGCEIPVKGVNSSVKNKNRKNLLKSALYAVASLIFRLNGGSTKRYFRLSGYNTHISSYFPKSMRDKSGYTEWLVGCSSAYKKEAFEEHSFDEDLQKFGGYALGEDSSFCTPWK
jgi:glycosyltransferase involved in cell wall biosynthesis